MLDRARYLDAAEPVVCPDRSIRLLVTGVDGPIGCSLADWLSRRIDVVGLYRNHPVTLARCRIARWEDARLDALARLVREARPRWVIHCGPFARGSWDLWDEALTDIAHERAVCRALIDASQQLDARLTVLSTDAVFAGPRLFHDEQSPAMSNHPLARAASAVERTFEGSGALVVRTHVFGWSPREEGPSFAERVWLALTEGAACPIDRHAYATPILAADLAQLLWLAYQRRLYGVCHIAGAERTSASRFGSELASVAGIGPPDRSTRGPGPTRGPAETSLDTRRARRQLGCPMPMLREGLARFVDQIRDGTRARLRGTSNTSARAEAA
jgi:dTDP-4-dehydrorhamnose reductase